jgi:hypothetical protein
MRNSATKEFWSAFGASLVRYVMFAVGAWLQTKGYLSADQTEGFTSYEVAATLAGVVLMGAPVWWSWAKQNFTMLYQKALHRADRDKPTEEIKNEVLKENSKFNTLPL